MNDAHLSDEQLSSHLGGDVDGAVDHVVDGAGVERGTNSSLVPGHLEGCGACRDRLARLTEVRDLVRRPVAQVSAEIRAAAVALALREAGSSDERVPVGEHRAAAALSEPVRLRRYPSTRVLGGVAAVLLLAAAITVPLVTSSSNTSPSSSASSAASGASSTTTPQPDRTSRRALAELPPGGTVDAGDLGAIGSASQLRARVAMDMVNVGGTHNSPSSQASTGATAGSAQAFSTLATCLPAATSAAGSNRSVVLTATADYRGSRVVVFVFGPRSGATGGAGARQVAVVTAVSGCRVLVDTSF
jgi:hypothetical protein